MRLTATETADVIVVGLGAFGSASLCQLARRGVRVIGIDRYAPPHSFGSSHGESRITRLAVGEGAAYAPLVRRSHTLWRLLEQETGAALLTETGGLIMAPGSGRTEHHGREDFVHRTIAVADGAGIAHEVLGAAEIAARFPQFRLRGDEVGYYEPSAGVLAPEACVAAQLQSARQHGADIRCDTRVTGLQQLGQSVRVTTDMGVFEAARCVLTAGPWLAELIAPALRPLVRVHRQTLHWFPTSDPGLYRPGRCPVFIWMHGAGNEDYFYGFPTFGDAPEVKVATEAYAEATDPDSVDRRIAPAEDRAMQARHLRGRLAAIGEQAARSTVCLYTVTPDFGFIADTLPGMEGVLAVSACSGHGFKHSAGLGDAIARRLLGEADDIDFAAFTLRRFT